ncbi:ParB/RepB/Spo0J family partition protein [Polaromonas sp. JS666]|uniref:ParB/RepB/Spo0J family partition protein n=1 Tax=Polaromonas sp. (strain JS666 / ATCC BAA-500) TaxID=296591 RepID=UPI0000D5B4B6|nr:ParB/RepB/Spo0J family partition protein [Polaromonas sp. JS666]ABE47367.1 hypothetical protein Bpro_5514 [Polaromonas sp. JS666]
MTKSNPQVNNSKRPAVPKLVLNLAEATTQMATHSEEVATNRFAQARNVTSEIPHGLARAALRPVPSSTAEDSGVAKSLSAPPGTIFNPATCQIGMVYSVPLGLVDPNPDGARHFYRSADVDRIAESLQENQQDDPANGFVRDGRVVLINGGTRLRAARSGGIPELLIRISAPLADRRELYKESARLNDERSDHTALDTAYRITCLLNEGVYSTQEEAGKDLTQRDGSPMTKSQVNMLFRIGKIPERLMRKMADHNQTSAFTIAYEISAIFVRPDYAEREMEYEILATEIIDQIQAKDLSKSQVQALINSKLVGPKTRQRAESTSISYAGAKGVIKIFPSRGELDLSMKGLTATKCEELKSLIEKACSGQYELGPAS